MRNLIFILTAAVMSVSCSSQTAQLDIERVKLMPNLPQPYRMKDWMAAAKAYDQAVFDLERKGEYLPLIWFDETKINVPITGFGLPSYIGHPKMTGGNSHEGINCMGVLVCSSLAGIDKSRQNGADWIAMAEDYFNSANGENVFLNSTSSLTGGSFWYELMPGILAVQISDLYPEKKEFAQKVIIQADRWYDACIAMGGSKEPWKVPDFDHTAFSISRKQPVDNGVWAEPDSAAGIAWIQYAAWKKTGESKYLDAVNWCLQFLELYRRNPFYELLLPYGAYTAARMNAEHGYGYDVDKLLEWIFGPSDARYGWGITAQRWGGFDCHGLCGSLIDGGGYAFAMNTYVVASQLVPMTRYDKRYCRAVGKWMLNAANASRLFYGEDLPPENQTCLEWKQKYDPESCFVYEGLRKKWKGKAPMAMGDPLVHGWAKTDLALYGSSYVGIMAAIITPTNVEGILKLDCLATDFARGGAYPTYLYYNPYKSPKKIEIDLGKDKLDIYETLSEKIIKKGVFGIKEIEIPADSAVQIVLLPAGKELFISRSPRSQADLDGIKVDFCADRISDPKMPPHAVLPRQEEPDNSRKVKAPNADIKVDGTADGWEGLDCDILKLRTLRSGKISCSLQYAWNKDYLFVLAKEIKGDITPVEAPDAKSFLDSVWGYDAFSLFIDIDNSSNRESVGDFNPWFGFSSTGRTDIFAVRSHQPVEMNQHMLSNSIVATSGSIQEGNRIIEAAISWADIAAGVSKTRQPGKDLLNAVKPGFVFGCEPLLLDDGWKTQSYIGGEKQPDGLDRNSCDIILTDRKNEF
jgi:hypothetical protein